MPLLGLLLVLLSPSGHAGPATLVECERAFAGEVAVLGMKQGFERALAPDAVLLRPRPVRGSDFLQQSRDDPGLLEWAPAYARTSRGGDLGFTYGPWRYRAARTNAMLDATGQYLTVWKGTPSGWKVALDAGLGGPAQTFPGMAELKGPDDVDEPLQTWEQTQRGRDLRFVEEAFARRAAREGESAALEAHGHKSVRVLRQGAPPMIGRGEGTRFLATRRHRTRDILQGLQISATGDLGFAWGESERLGSGTSPSLTVRSWVRVWSRSGWTGTWRVALDLAVDYREDGVEQPRPAGP